MTTISGSKRFADENDVPRKRQEYTPQLDVFTKAIHLKEFEQRQKNWQIAQKYSKMSYSECMQLCIFIQDYSRKHLLKPQHEGESIYINDDSRLPRTVLFDEGKGLIQINKIRLGDALVGRGGERKARLAIDTYDCKVIIVAVTAIESMDTRKRSQKETKIIQSLDGHESIARVYKTIEVMGKKGIKKIFSLQPYYSMGNLSSLIKNRSLSDKDKCRITLNVLKAFAILEENSIIHRDIKPDNFFLFPNAQSEPQAHLGDFGFACRIEEIMNEAILKGTPSYVSPEFCIALREGKHTSPDILISHRQDAWAVGVTLFELFTSRRLVRAITQVGIIEAVAEIKQSDIPKRISKISVINKLVQCLLRVNPFSRLTGMRCMELFERKIKEVINP